MWLILSLLIIQGILIVKEQQNLGNSYNPNWRNHPNFTYGGNQIQNTNQHWRKVQKNHKQHFQGNQAITQPSNIQQIVKKIMAMQAQFVEDVKIQ